MILISDDDFEMLVADAIDRIDEEHRDKLDNVAIVIEDFPNPDQLMKGRVGPGGSLFGLYEGIPQYKRGNSYSGVLPDKITVFKWPILRSVWTPQELIERVRNTVWHEIAHHYGLGHDQIHKLEHKS